MSNISLPSSLPVPAPPYSGKRNDRNVLSHSAAAGIQQRRTVGEYINDIIYYIILCAAGAPYVFTGRGRRAPCFPSKVHRGSSTYPPRAGSGRPSSFEPARQADWCFLQLRDPIQCSTYIILYYIRERLLWGHQSM